MPMKTFDPQALGPRATYQLMTCIIAPRPIAFVSSLSPEGVPNLAPYSYFNAGGANPPSTVFCVTNRRDGSPKDTLRNVEATKEYVVNLVNYDLAERMNQTSFDYEYGINEFEKAGLTPQPSLYIKPARVLESHIQMECRLFEVVRHGEGALASHYVIGEVLCFHISELLLKNGHIVDDLVADFIGRMGESWYTRATPDAMFRLPKPENP
jgi:flavin reductase (DIM6/NTAB) family NADH-FMN oxidoreductase RutF